MWFLLLFVLLSTNVNALQEKICPPTDSIPCTCSKFNDDPVVECQSSSLSEQDMSSVLSTLKDYKLGSLTFTNTNFETANEDMYNGLHVKMMELKVVTIGNFSSRPGDLLLTGLENSLNVLSVVDSFHSGAALNHMALGRMDSLKLVTIRGSAISDLGNEWFAEGPKGLDTVMFTETGIQRLGDRVFQALEDLRDLNLMGNDIREIRRSMLPSPGPNLEEINLYSNKLTDLPADLFTDLPVLRNIDLGKNEIKTLPQGLILSNPTLSIRVNLYRNPISCDEDLKWICHTSNKLSGVCAGSVMAGTSLSDFCAQQLRR